MQAAIWRPKDSQTDDIETLLCLVIVIHFMLYPEHICLMNLETIKHSICIIYLVTFTQMTTNELEIIITILTISSGLRIPNCTLRAVRSGALLSIAAIVLTLEAHNYTKKFH